MNKEKEDKRDQQNARALLRTKFLHAISELNDQPCYMTTIEKSKLSGNFKGWKSDGSQILVDNLMTPAGLINKTSLIRATDILSIEYTNDIQLSNHCNSVKDEVIVNPGMNMNGKSIDTSTSDGVGQA